MAYYETYNPTYGAGPRLSRRSRFGTSPTELFHLGVAIAALTTAIVLWMTKSNYVEFEELDLWAKVTVAAGITVTGFALHEIGHKITAQHYGHWSEFRFSVPGLILTLLMGSVGFLFGAPGATWHTATSPRDNGKISAAGPLINIVIAVLAFPFTTGQLGSGLPGLVADAVLLFNTILAGFNLIPLGPLDGRKIVRWNAAAYFILVGLVVLLVIYANPFAVFIDGDG